MVPWLFVLPILLINVVVVVGTGDVRVLLLDDRMERDRQGEWIGLDNFRRLLFEDPSFWHAFSNNLIWMAMFLTVPIALALLAASLLAPITAGGDHLPDGALPSLCAAERGRRRHLADPAAARRGHPAPS